METAVLDNLSTQERIRYTCFELMKEKPIDKILVREIAENAKISRGTFYIHYESIYSLLDEVCDEILDNIAMQQRNALRYKITEKDFIVPHPLLLSSFTFVKKTLHEHQALWGEYGYTKFQEQARALIKATIFSKLVFDGKIQNNIEYFERYITDGFIALQTKWILNGCVESPAEMVLITTELCYKSFYYDSLDI